MLQQMHPQIFVLVDNEKQRRESLINADGSVKLELLDTKYQQLLNLKKLVVQSGFKGNMIAMSPNQRIYITSDLNLEYVSLDSVVKATAVLRNLASSNYEENSSNDKSETVFSMRLNIDNDEIRIDVRTIDNGPSEPQSEVYINGNLTSEKEMTDLFGENNPALVSRTLMKSFL